MLNSKLPSRLKSLLPFIVLLVVLVLLMPRASKFNFDYRKGYAWKYDSLISQFDFPIYKTDSQIRDEISSSNNEAVPYYRYSEDVVNSRIKDAQSLPLGSHNDMRSFIVSELRSIYSLGVVSDKGVQVDRHSSVEVMYIHRDKKAAKYPISEIYKQSDARIKFMADLSAEYPKVNVDSLFREIDLEALIVPNLVYDSQTTELLQAESVKEVSPTQGYIPAGTLIVSNGEIVTGDIAQMLDSYKREYEANIGYSGPQVTQIAGNIVLAVILVLLLALVIVIFRPRLYQHRNQLLFVLTIFCITSVGAMSVKGSFQEFYFLIPFTLCAVCMRAFYDKAFSLAIYALALLPLLIFANDGAELYLMFLLAGVVAIILYDYFGKSWKQLFLALGSFCALAVSYTSFLLTGALDGSPRAVWYMFLGSMMVFAGYPITLLFEGLFNLISESRLEELADTDNKLLRKLESEAPGTFQHCLHVMNMADEAVRSVGGNVPLVRAAAMYHDIGKMVNPLCFKENEALLPNVNGQMYHDGLTPEQSAADIIKHVDDGLAIADQYRLPQVIKGFIKSHHGTSMTSYFYTQYVNNGGNPDNTAPFTYHGVKPQTKEQIILMLCDSVEAASRTLKENTPEAFSALVDGIFKTKFNQGQFEDANISIKDINIVKDKLKTYLAQLYHGRIAYPNRQITNDNKDESNKESD